jgi:hypothetical protein
MKKLIAIFGVMALAACGGDGGEGGDTAVTDSAAAGTTIEAAPVTTPMPGDTTLATTPAMGTDTAAGMTTGTDTAAGTTTP